jgi:hypothetical protein
MRENGKGEKRKMEVFNSCLHFSPFPILPFRNPTAILQAVPHLHVLREAGQTEPPLAKSGERGRARKVTGSFESLLDIFCQKPNTALFSHQAKSIIGVGGFRTARPQGHELSRNQASIQKERRCAEVRAGGNQIGTLGF